jgi:pilus assembly protein CpaE
VVVEPPSDEVTKLELLTGGQQELELAAHAYTAVEALGAIKSLSTHRGAAAIVSLGLSGPRDAFWLIRAIRDRFPTLSILACHTNADEATISRAFFAGADGYIDTTAGSARFLRALRQVVAGEVSLLDDSSPEPEAVEEVESDEASSKVDEQPAAEEEAQMTTGGPRSVPSSRPLPVPAPPPAAVVTERALPEKARRRWFGTRKERRTHPVPEPPARVQVDETPRSLVVEEPAAEPDVVRPAETTEFQPPAEPTGFQPPIRLEPPVQPSSAPPASAEKGPDSATETVWAPGAEWDTEVVEQIRSRLGYDEPPAPEIHEAALETVWADEREIAAPPPPRTEVDAPPEPEREPEPEAALLPEPESEALPEPVPEPAAEPAPVAQPQPVARAEPEPEPEGQPNHAAILAVGPSPTFGRDLARMVNKEPADVLRLATATAAEGYLAEHKDCSVLVASGELKEADALGLAEFASWRSPTTAVVLVRQQYSDKLLQKAMRAGVREVVELEAGSGQLLADAIERAIAWSEGLRSARRQPPRVTVRGESEGTLISVISSRGGTGKTFLASNLAAAIALKTRTDTAILDLDLEDGDVFSYFGQEPRRRPHELVWLGNGRTSADVLRAGVPLGSEVFGYAAHSEPGDGTDVTTEATAELLKSLRQTFAYTIVDCSASYSDHALTALELSDRICLVAALDASEVRHLSRAMDALRGLGFPSERLLFVLNRADNRVDLSPRDVQEVMKLHVDARIPSSALVPVSLNKGRPIVLDVPSAEVSRAIERLADRVVAIRAAADRTEP